MSNKKVIVGMSGGIDSSVAMYLLKKEGYEPIGVSLKYDVWDDPENELKENVCCNEESFEIAAHVCELLDVPYRIVDVKDKFNKEVVDYFKSELKANRTPNPCVVCNRNLKFKELFNVAEEEGAAFVATGHYAKIKDGKIYRAKDDNKDQTYTLSFLKKEWLDKILFPLADYTKEEAQKIAKKAGFVFYLHRKQSQDFCYVSDKSMKKFLEKEIGINQGEIKDSEGNVLGHHQGLHFYTIGQRKGLVNIPNGPYFVIDKDQKKNELIISNKEKGDALYKSELTLDPYNLFIDFPKEEIEVEAKIRYRQDFAKAKLYSEGDQLKLLFNSPQRAVTKGQYAVFYDDKGRLLGSGRII
jgi:tRNA-uridine 2-sulfurtransferase